MTNKLLTTQIRSQELSNFQFIFFFVIWVIVFCRLRDDGKEREELSCVLHFLSTGCYGYTAVTRSPEPRLWDRAAPREGEVESCAREALTCASLPLATHRIAATLPSGPTLPNPQGCKILSYFGKQKQI